MRVVEPVLGWRRHFDVIERTTDLLKDLLLTSGGDVAQLAHGEPAHELEGLWVLPVEVPRLVAHQCFQGAEEQRLVGFLVVLL